MTTVRTVTRAWCEGCDWTDTGPRPDTAFERHCKATGHTTHCETRPVHRVYCAPVPEETR